MVIGQRRGGVETAGHGPASCQERMHAHTLTRYRKLERLVPLRNFLEELLLTTKVVNGVIAPCSTSRSSRIRRPPQWLSSQSGAGCSRNYPSLPPQRRSPRAKIL